MLDSLPETITLSMCEMQAYGARRSARVVASVAKVRLLPILGHGSRRRFSLGPSRG
jgi:hypothetical protein